MVSAGQSRRSLWSQQVDQGGTGRGWEESGGGAELALRMLPWRWPGRAKRGVRRGWSAPLWGSSLTAELTPLTPSAGLCSSSRRLQEGPQPELGARRQPSRGRRGTGSLRLSRV